ncbi:MAG TPA: PIG-L family deacetylase [Acidimicrobiales bacterium]
MPTPPTRRPAVTAGRLPRVTSAVAVCAHPDDESFGLGGLLHALGAAGSRIAVLCFTHGEASTLHGVDGDLGAVRARELAEAGRHLGAGRVELLGYPDGSLAAQRADELAGHVRRVAGEVGADALVVFDLGGVTGHPDHDAATRAALTAADRLDVTVLAWTVPDTVAHTLNGELGTAFAGRARHEVDAVLAVDRRAQLAAIGCHASQARHNPVLRRRLELQGPVEWVRMLR